MTFFAPIILRPAPVNPEFLFEPIMEVFEFTLTSALSLIIPLTLIILALSPLTALTSCE